MPIRSLSPKDVGRVMSEGPPKLAPLVLQVTPAISKAKCFITLISVLFWILAPRRASHKSKS